MRIPQLSWQYWFLIIAPLLLLAPVWLAGDNLFWGTPVLQFVPWWHTAVEQMRAGLLPLWNPLVGMGAPLLANYQAALLYPPVWGLLLAGGLGGAAGIGAGLTWYVALHWIWAGLGMAAFTRRLGIGALGQVVGGLAFGLSGYLVAKTSFLSIAAAVPWLPWILWAVEGLLRAPALRHAALKPTLLLAVVTGMQLLAGHAQTAWYTLLLAGLWVVYRASRLRSLTQFLAYSGQFTLGVLGGVCLAAAQLLPTAEYLLQSQRAAAVDYDFAMTYSFWPWRLLGLFAPDLFGNPAHGDFWGYATYWEDTLYIGLLPALLALGFLFGRQQPSTGNEAPGLRGFTLTIGMVGLVLAFGSNTPVFPWLYAHIPTFSMFQAPARWLLWVIWGLSLLAAGGADRLQPPTGKRLYWTRLATAGAVAVMLGAGIGWLLLEGSADTARLASMVRAVTLAGWWGAGAGFLVLVMPAALSSQRGSAWQFAVAAWLSLDLLVAGWGLNPGASPKIYQSQPEQANEVARLVGAGRLFLPEADERNLKFDQYFTFEQFQIAQDWQNVRLTWLPNLNLLDGIASANNFDPLVPGRYARWMKALNALEQPERASYLNLMAVNAVVSVKSSPPGGVEIEQIAVNELVRWYACSTAVVGEEQAWQAVRSRQAGLEERVIIEGWQGADECVPAANPAELSILQANAQMLRLAVTTDAAGWLTWSQTWYPGWQGSLDGEPVQVYRANYLFQAIHVPPGEHVIEFVYQPGWFWMGAGVSVVTWFLVSIGIIFSHKQKHANSEPNGAN